MEKLLSIDDVAEALGVPKGTLYKWSHRRDGSGPPAYRVGKYLKYRTSDVERWLDQRQKAS